MQQKKISPSLQHLQLLEKLYKQRHVRQINWNTAVCPDADPFSDYWDHTNSNSIASSSISPSKRSKRLQRNKKTTGKGSNSGMYIPIDPTHHFNSLPSHTPMLSTHKHRLPMRSDVGFPGPSEEEVRIKQLEIQKEAELEEASPRIIVLASKDMIGFYPHEVDIRPPSSSSTSTSSSSSAHSKGIPPKRNRHDPTSMFAPPIDATPSSTYGWRSRPFWDRPPGMNYLVVSPMDIMFDVGNVVEPLICTLSLYCIPPTSTSKHHKQRTPMDPTMNSNSNSNSNSSSNSSEEGGANIFRGKISEDFVFPAGDWNDSLQEKAAGRLAQQFQAAQKYGSGGGGGSNSGSSRSSPSKKSVHPSDNDIPNWKRRKRKALFSFDPNALPSLSSSSVLESLFIVIQIHKVSQENALKQYNSHTHSSSFSSSSSNNHKDTSFSSTKTRTFGKPRVFGKKQNHKSNNQNSAKAIFENFGTQHLTPIAFGIAPVHNHSRLSSSNVDVTSTEGDQFHWPNGKQQTVQLYSFPDYPESQEDFVRRLTKFVDYSIYQQEELTTVNEHIDHQDDMDDSTLSSSFLNDDSSILSTSFETKKSTSMFRLKSTRKKKYTEVPKDHDMMSHISNLQLLGSASLFVSYVDVDFTQLLLQTPEKLSSTPSANHHSSSSIDESDIKLLVDVSGDCAILLNPHAQSSSKRSKRGNRRSDLSRLSSSDAPSEYSDSFDVKEVLYFPPRTNKRFDGYIPALTTSFLNLLYLYPRLLRLPPDQNGKVHTTSSTKKLLNATQFFTVRIRLVQQLNGSKETVILESIYNPAPGGTNLLEAIYTKIPHSLSNKKQGSNMDVLKKGINLRDEIKVRLPTVLNGGHFLNFSLFSVGMHKNDTGESDGYKFDLLEENWIPLSNTATEESSSGTKITTIIPNGIHRIKLGPFQLQLETKLVSSIHNSDPAVAVALRDFPQNKGYSEDGARISMPDFGQILKNASEHALVNHCQPLLLVHILNLLNYGSYEFDFDYIQETLINNNFHKNKTQQSQKSHNPHFAGMMRNMMSMFAIIKKIKIKFSSKGMMNSAQLNYFLKVFFDSFDEISLRKYEHRPISSDFSVESQLDISSSSKSLDVSDLSMTSKPFTLNQSDHEIEMLSETVIDTIEETLLDAAVKVVLKQESRNAFGTNPRDIPFSRRAYGISKTDRMRAEAELEEENKYSRVFDDEETVFTVDTLRSRDQFPPHQISGIANDELSIISELHTGTGIAEKKTRVVSLPSTTSRLNTKNGPKRKPNSIRDKVSNMSTFVEDNNFVKRVNLFAQVVIAPCMGPTIPNNQASANLNATKSSLHQSALISNFKETMEKQVTNNFEMESDAIFELFSPGSDVDEEEFCDRTSLINPKQAHYNKWVHSGSITSSKLRGIHKDDQDSQLEFSFSSIDPSNSDDYFFSNKNEPFFYECIFTLWLEAWRDAISQSKSIFPPSILAYISQIDFILPLSLKSLALRCASSNSGRSIVPQTILDKRHMDVFEAIINICARGLMYQGLNSELIDGDRDKAMQTAIHNSNIVINFLIGLLAVIHPAQVSELIENYLKTLRKCEQIDIENFRACDNNQQELKPTLQTHVRKCSNLLRLRAIENLSKIPGFISLNYPLKHKKCYRSKRYSITSWKVQYSQNQCKIPNNDQNEIYLDELKHIPKSGWLAEIISSEAFLICRNAYKALHGDVFLIENRYVKLNLTERDQLQFESIAEQSITFIYELFVRRHSMDSRFQTEAGRGRLASMFVHIILQNSFENLNLLKDLEPLNRIRTLWLLNFLYILQEVPESLLQHHISLCCTVKEGYSIHKFIDLLKLSCITCQCFIVNSGGVKLVNSNDEKKCCINLWLVQESFNTICAAVIILVDECSDIMSSSPNQEKQVAQGIFDLLLLTATIPQSSVTHLRSLGGASHAFDKFGAALFVEVVGDDLQHWARLILTLMNSTALSVRSIAVDLIVSIFGGVFNEYGNVDELTLVFLSVIPEVVAREIGMYSISRHIDSMLDVECTLWPLRRALADVEETNPLDDDRVDVQLVPFLVTFCRTCQAIIDGVVIELRLMENDGSDVIQKTFGRTFVLNSIDVNKNDGNRHPQSDHTFDADEESLFEAANFFQTETAPLQRLRWLITLKSLHESKGQWVEAAEVLLLCARTIAEAIPHIESVWRPSRFDLWHDISKSLWLSVLGPEQKSNITINTEMMKFASKFLEPPNLLRVSNPSISTSGKLFSPTVSVMCKMLTRVSRESVQCFLQEEGLESLAFLRLEQLLMSVMDVVEDHTVIGCSGMDNKSSIKYRTLLVEESASLRKMSATLNGDMTKLAERMLLIAEEGPDSDVARQETISNQRHHYYVRVILLGRKPDRFKESTAIPTFLEWESPSICRVAKRFILKAISNKKKGTLSGGNGGKMAPYDFYSGSLNEYICSAFAEPLIHSLAKELPMNSIVLTKEIPSKEILGDEGESNTTYLVVNLVHMRPSLRNRNVEYDPIAQGGSKRFYFRNKPFLNSFRQQGSSVKAGFIELTVANCFPCGLSRQRTVITSEYFAGN